MRKIFLIKTLSFMLFVAMLMTSTIMPVNASVLKEGVTAPDSNYKTSNGSMQEKQQTIWLV